MILRQYEKKTGLAYAGDRTKNKAFNEWNEDRNILKHHDKRDSDTLKFSVFDEAYHAIQRANLDGEKLGVVAANREDYENWLIENIYM